MVILTKSEQWLAVSNLREAFDDSDLPFRVDLFVWGEVPEHFHANMRASHVVLQGNPDDDLYQSFRVRAHIESDDG